MRSPRAASPPRPTSPLLAFVLAALAIVLASRAVVGSAGFARHPDALAVAVTADLTLTLAAVAWLTLVRTRLAPPMALVAVALLGLALASALLPPAQQALPARLGTLLAPAELLLLGWLGWSARRIARAARRLGADLPAEEALRRAATEVLGPYRAIEVLVSEATVVGFALFGWRRAPHVPAGAAPFWVHRRSGAGALLGALLLAGLGETLAAHFLLSHWSRGWAWALTTLSAYSVLWLVGDFRAMVLRPTLVTGGALELRLGLRWRATIPLERIRRACEGPDPAHHRGCVVASPIGPPNLYLHLDGPAELHGLFGLRRRGECVGLRVDEPAALAALLRSALTAGTAASPPARVRPP